MQRFSLWRALVGPAQDPLGCGARLTLICMSWLASMSQDTYGGPCKMSTVSRSPEGHISSTFTVTVRGLRVDRPLRHRGPERGVRRGLTGTGLGSNSSLYTITWRDVGQWRRWAELRLRDGGQGRG